MKVAIRHPLVSSASSDSGWTCPACQVRAESQRDLQQAGAAVSAAKRHIVEMADQAEAAEGAAEKLRRELATAAEREADTRDEARVNCTHRPSRSGN